MENAVFLVDLPRLPAASPAQDLTFFGREMMYFLRAMELQPDVVEAVAKFDFAGTKHLAFVHTIGGSHSGDTWRRTGYGGLATAIDTLGLRSQDPMELDFVASSVGSLITQFLSTIFLAAHGEDPLMEYHWRNPLKPTARSKKGEPQGPRSLGEKDVLERMRSDFRIYFPTHETIVNSKGGPSFGGTICLQSRWYDGPSFPRDLFRQCKSQRAGLLMHNKVRIRLEAAWSSAET